MRSPRCWPVMCYMRRWRWSPLPAWCPGKQLITICARMIPHHPWAPMVHVTCVAYHVNFRPSHSIYSLLAQACPRHGQSSMKGRVLGDLQVQCDMGEGRRVTLEQHECDRMY
jgi:hypothetical protein